MPYRLKIEESVADGIQRLCAEQIDRAVAEIDDDDLDRHETVHQVRKRCKKIRGALRLARGELDRDHTYSDENAWFRDAAKTLSYVRDAEALVETWDALIDHFRDQLDVAELEPIRHHLTARRQEIADQEMALDERLAQFRAQMLVARERIGDWPIESRGFDALQPGLEKTYRRCRKSFDQAYAQPGDETFHEWRKRVKYHWYHCRLLRDIWPTVMRARRDEADRLADMLGDEHDLSVFRQTLTDEADAVQSPEKVKLVLELATLHRMSLRQRAELLGRRLLAEKPKQLGRRLRAYFAAWRGTPAAD